MEHRPIVELLATQAFPELAAALRAGTAVALQRWEARVREVLPIADGLTFEQLRDDMPIVLEQMAASLESDRGAETQELLHTVPKHGVVRFHQSFSLAEMLIEYDLLRALVMEEVVTNIGRAIEAMEVVALDGALSLAGRRSVLAFVNHQSAELKAATDAQSKYLSFLSHDLRGGLNGVLLMIEVLKRELADEPRFAETIGDVDSMRRSLLETVGTMDRFLHAERFRKGKIQLKPGPVNLRNLLGETVAHFSYQAKEKGLAVRIETPSECMITSDRELLTLVLQNLLSNAVKYAEVGEIVVSATPAEHGEYLVAVRDQGPGIEPERLDELFDTYSRGETHGKPGMGLGLSIARQAADFVGATLWAESAKGQGSTFYVRIPAEPPRGH
jgi:signal transduction histidine kinase